MQILVTLSTALRIIFVLLQELFESVTLILKMRIYYIFAFLFIVIMFFTLEFFNPRCYNNSD